MRNAVGALAPVLTLAGCFVTQPIGEPVPPPDIQDATLALNAVIDAGIDRDFERLCALATGTCAHELDGLEHLAHREAPIVVDTQVHQPRLDPDGWNEGGVLFVLCGTDASGTRYESEVLVIDAGPQLLTAATVFWKATCVSFAPPGNAVAGEPDPGPARCP
jgi:hypothetical protein